MKAGRRSGARCRAGFEPLSLFPHSREIVWNVHSFQHNEMHCSYVTSLSFPTAVYKRKTNNSACWDGSSCSHSAVSAGQAFSAPLLFPLHSVLLHTFGSSVNLQILRVFFPQLPLICTERLTQICFESINTLSRHFNFLFPGLFLFVVLPNCQVLCTLPHVRLFKSKTFPLSWKAMIILSELIKVSSLPQKQNWIALGVDCYHINPGARNSFYTTIKVHFIPSSAAWIVV